MHQYKIGSAIFFFCVMYSVACTGTSWGPKSRPLYPPPFATVGILNLRYTGVYSLLFSTIIMSSFNIKKNKMHENVDQLHLKKCFYVSTSTPVKLRSFGQSPKNEEVFYQPSFS